MPRGQDLSEGYHSKVWADASLKCFWVHPIMLSWGCTTLDPLCANGLPLPPSRVMRYTYGIRDTLTARGQRHASHERQSQHTPVLPAPLGGVTPRGFGVTPRDPSAPCAKHAKQTRKIHNTNTQKKNQKC